MTTISVCIPVHNGAVYLGAALDSVLEQTATPFSTVVSDNASTDDTPSVIARYLEHDRISSSRSEAFLAQAESMNRALDLGDGEWLKPLCHDDLLEPDCVEQLAEALDGLPESVGLVGHAESHLFANGYLHRPRSWSGDVRVMKGRDLLRRLLDGTDVPQLPSLTTAIVRRSAWGLGERFDARYSHSDVFCWARLLMRCDYAYVDVPLTINRIHAAQVAVAARASQRTTHEQHEFWNAFVDEFGVALGLSRQAVVRARLRGAASAGSAAAIQILKGQPRAAAEALRGSPKRWWPVLPVLTARAYLMERTRIRELRTQVPLELIYP